MLRRLSLCVFAAAALFAAAPAEAHPHVFVTVRSTVVYGDGAARAVRHAWRFDDMFSAFAVQGLDKNADGTLDRAELQDLAKVNVTSLKEFDFFTYAKAGGKTAGFKPPVDYWLEHDGTALTLHFTLPLAAPTAVAPLRLEIYDPSYFVAFALAKTDAARLEGAPDGCRVDATPPPASDDAVTSGAGAKLGEEFFSSLDPASGFGQKYANVMTVRCGEDALAYAASLTPAASEPTAPPPEAPDIAPPPQQEAAPEAAPSPPPPSSAYAPRETPDVIGALLEKEAPMAADIPALDPIGLRVDQAMQIAEAAPLGELPAERIGSVERQPAASSSSSSSSSALGAFGVVRPDGSLAQTPVTGLFGWITRQQSAFYRLMSEALTASKADGSAFLMLAGLSFAYGVFHAAGPGHGKAVISSYLLASGETLRRGVAISFAASIVQAVTAIAVVGVMALVLGATSQAMGAATWWLEAASYVLIALIGGSLLVRSGASAFGRTPAMAGMHVHGPGCGHDHMPSPGALGGPFDWRRAASAVAAIGLRPCTGALLILVFALAQGLIWTGVAATFAMAFGTALTVATIAALAVGAKGLAVRLASGLSGGAAVIAARSVELAAGFAVMAFGLLLLGGLLSTGAPAG